MKTIKRCKMKLMIHFLHFRIRKAMKIIMPTKMSDFKKIIIMEAVNIYLASRNEYLF